MAGGRERGKQDKDRKARAETSRARTWSRATLIAFCSGCAASSPPVAPTVATVPSAYVGGTTDATSQLVLDLAVAQACAHMRGRFIALPEQGHAPTGAASGLVPADGRWLIEQCEAASVNGTLRLRLSGLGWKWVDVDRKMNAVRQYVYFNAAVEMEGHGEDAETVGQAGVRRVRVRKMRHLKLLQVA